MSFKRIEINDLQINPIEMFGDKWPLLTAGGEGDYNTMTISWGHMGNLWTGAANPGPTMIVYVRPQRHTHNFTENNDFFTVSVLPPTHKDALTYLGRVSGRDEDKVANAGLTPIFAGGRAYFEEADMVFVCRKIYKKRIKESGFIDKYIMNNIYPEKDFHTMYIGQIVDVLVKG